MKRQFTKVIGTSVIALSMALPFATPASAQTTTDPGATTAPGTTTDTRAYGDNDFDWGWLGLLGLLGLAGLAGRGRREEPNRYRDPNTVGSTTYRE
ncbi:WGxxGxxG family protein [Brasilonema sp. UFV-L1]|uniref:WGxxGxxG family protein n=1 Tax=Brasilonema sp. UFV-L1 TaxID=2234130 RepID=UPI00145F21A9|nr:WGxxGxxG family protein [Brasilonema sp. UFV-L1]NMG07333.1 hypothetical protein [Brasilonema sp. UFV-L1]